MKYKVLHSALLGPSRNFRRDEIASERELKDAGFDPAFLLKNEAVEPVAGTEYDDALSMTSDAGAGDAGAADPNAATAPHAAVAHGHKARSGKS